MILMWDDGRSTGEVEHETAGLAVVAHWDVEVVDG